MGIHSLSLALLVPWLATTTYVQTSKPVPNRNSDPGKLIEPLAREVRHELLTLPWYGIFDWLEAGIASGGRVSLEGWVLRETTRSDADMRIRNIEGVSQLRNNIRVLPDSTQDEQLRRALFYALFGNDSRLFQYALGSQPSIHIVVEGGHVILKGAVANTADSDFALNRANSVPGVFDVKNQLRVTGR